MSLPSPEECEALIAAARQAAGRTFRLDHIGGGIGAAVLTAAGHIYPAGTYYTDVLTLTIHAELGALIHAAAHAEYRIRAVVAVRLADDGTWAIVPPCGLCRQALNETSAYAGLPLTVLLAAPTPPGYRLVPLAELLPIPFPQWRWAMNQAEPIRPPDAEPAPDPGGHHPRSF